MAEFPLLAPELGSISPSLDLLPKDINPQARELLQADRIAQNPMAQFKEVKPNFVDAGGAKQIDLNARERLGGFRNPMDQFKEVAGPTLSGFKEADDLDLKSVEELNANRKGFDPVAYFAQNPDAPRDPKKFSKLLEVARRRYDEGLTAGGVAGAMLSKEAGKTLGEVVTTAPVSLMERGVELFVQPTANVVLGALTGDLFNKQRREALFNETSKIVKKAEGEGASGIESASVGVVDLSRQGLRKLDAASQAPVVGSEFDTPAIPTKKPKTDQEILTQLSDDAAFRKNAEEILTGQGEAAKFVGLDKETLAKQGVELDPEAIRLISLVDPVTMVATGGVFKLIGVGGKVLATAKTLAGAEFAAKHLADFAQWSTSKVAKGGGAVLTGIGKVAESKTVSNIALGSALGTGDLSSVATTAGIKYVAGPVARKTGAALTQIGEQIAEDVPRSAAIQRIIDFTNISGRAASEVGQGAFTGIAAAAPFAVMADDDQQAGTLLGAGAALGAAHAAGTRTLKAGTEAFRVVKDAAAREYFGQNRPALENVESPGYGEATSDALHEKQLQKLPMQDVSEVNNFREVLRPLGKKILAVDQPTFRARIKETMPDVTPEQLDIYENHSAFFNSADTVYLNSDATGLHHDAGHLFDSLIAPEKVAELDKAITDTFGQKSIDDFKATYERRVGNKINDKTALSEYRAEQFAALFNNVPVTELNAPKSLLKKFVDVAAGGAEALGIDLTGGEKTPNLGAPVSVGIRKLFQNAAGDVARRSIEAKAEGASVPPTSPPEPPAASAIPDITPAPTSSIAGTTAPNIRVTKAQQDSFSHRNAETGIARARELAASDPVVAARVEEISKSLEAGNPVLEIEHLGIASETPAAGRRTRVGEQEAGYAELDRLQVENRAEAPASVVGSHSKTFVPVRWTEQGGTPTLIAVSLDKTIANVRRIAKESVGKGVEDLIPYKMENGKFTDDAWNKIIEDSKTYAENQSNGFRGDGKKLVRPGVDVNLSIPAENPNYAPKILSDEVSDFMNLLQGLNTPATAREVRGQIPGNIKAQVLAEANKRTLLEPASIRPRNAGKQEFSVPGRTVKEVNPMRRDLIARGVDIDKLIPTTERLRAKDIVSVKSRPELGFKAPVTDIVRGGFLPAPTEFRSKNLQGRTVSEFSEYILNASPEEWKAATDNMTGGLTGGAWNLGLGLKDAADLGVLKTYQEKLSTATKEAMQAGNFDAAYSLVSKGQFFRESYEAGSGTGSAGAAFKRNVMGTEGFKVPFPQEEPKK